MDYPELRRIQKLEMESSQIAKLEEQFYSRVAEFLNARKEEAFRSKSILSIREYENIRKIVLAIQARREEKIVLMAVRGEREGAGLTAEEHIMLKDLASIIERARSRVTDAWSREEPAGQSSNLKVKMLRDVEQYRGRDEALYGPFASGEERLLPADEAKWLLKAGMAAAT